MAHCRRLQREAQFEVITIDGKTKARLPASSLVQRARKTRTNVMIAHIEAAALAMFLERGFASVTVEEIAVAAQISPRTFYRYFPVKEDVLQVRIRQRAEALRDALAERSGTDEPLLHSVRMAIEAVLASEDVVLLKRWITVVAATPNVLKTVLGAKILALNAVLAEFFGARLGAPAEALAPEMLAAAVSGIIQAAQTRWHFRGGSLPRLVSESLRVLEDGVGAKIAPATRARRRRRAAHDGAGSPGRHKLSRP